VLDNALIAENFVKAELHPSSSPRRSSMISTDSFFICRRFCGITPQDYRPKNREKNGSETNLN
jgi:hypothetical protein